MIQPGRVRRAHLPAGYPSRVADDGTAHSVSLRAARLTLASMVALAAIGLISCGASMRGLYEGDVRFEHCMALDTRSDIKPTLRRSCWEEWITFYTFGQTRDRIDHAQERIVELAAASDFDESEWVPAKTHGPSALPDPTSAIAPPPMLVETDAGVVDAGPKANAESEGKCSDGCQKVHDDCRKLCKGPACERACAARQERCLRRCE